MSDDTRFVPCPLRSAATAAPDVAALVGARGSISFAELDKRVSAAALRLGELEPGSRVALYLPKDERYVVSMLALIRAGHVACPISDRLPPKGIAPLIERAACSALISDDGDLLQTAALRGLSPETLLGEIRRRTEPAADVPLGRPATVVFTSGSTGGPKAALHTFGNHYHNALGSNANIALRPGDRWLHSLPLYHVGGLSILFRCMLARATIVLPQQGSPLAESIVRLAATHVSLVATQLSRLLREKIDRPIDEDGWFHTGDLGTLDENGYLRVEGRKDNLFVSGGENIQPEEIEEALYHLNGIDEAVIVPVSDREFGHRPVAFVRTGRDLESLAPELEKMLPRFKIPTAFHPWPEKTQRGMKPDRSALRELARELQNQE